MQFAVLKHVSCIRNCASGVKIEKWKCVEPTVHTGGCACGVIKQAATVHLDQEFKIGCIHEIYNFARHRVSTLQYTFKAF